MKRIGSYAIAVAVMLAWVGMLSAIGLLVVWAWPSVIGLLVAGVLAAAAVFTRPRLPKLEQGVVVASAGEYPRLHAELVVLAQAMSAKPPDVFAFSSEFNAHTMRIGFRRRHVIVVGMLLWDFLEPDEQRAVVAHEIAHDVNGDIRRGFLVGTSLDMLHGWIELLHPGPWALVREASPTDMATWVLMRVLVAPLALLYRLQVSLTLEQSRAAEYAADALSHGVVGDAAVSALDKMRFRSSVEFGLEQAVRRRERPLLGAGKRRFGELTIEQVEELRAAELHAVHSVDSTHPPTSERIERLRAGATTVRAQPAIGWRWMNEELDSVREQIEARMEDGVIAQRYG